MANESYYVGNDISITVELQRTGDTLDVSGASTFYIRYKKPDGTVGYWTGSLSGTHQITYSASNSDIDAAGTWYMKGYVEYADGTKYQGEPVAVQIRRKWQTRK